MAVAFYHLNDFTGLSIDRPLSQEVMTRFDEWRIVETAKPFYPMFAVKLWKFASIWEHCISG